MARDTKKVMRPNPVLYGAAYVLVYPLLKLLFQFDDGRKKLAPPKGPFIVVSNHSTMVDFLLVMLPFFPRRINAVTANKYFYTPALSKILPIMGCIPKNQFDPDIRSIKGVKTVLKRGDCILMFPEGRCSTDGSFVGIHKATGKLIKNLGVPVISCYIDGAYTCMPHWRKGIRLGRMRVAIDELFSAEDTQSLSAEDINSAICTRLSGSDMPMSRKPIRTFRARRLAEGLHQILYWCPKCGGELTMMTKGNLIRCTACGNAAALDRAGRLVPTMGSIVPDSIHDWYLEQAKHISECFADDMEPLCIDVTVKVATAQDFVNQDGIGTLRFDPTGWHFDGKLSGKDISLFFPIETVPAMPFEHDENFQIYAHGKIYKFTPEDARMSAWYSQLGECAHKRFAERVMLTQV